MEKITTNKFAINLFMVLYSIADFFVHYEVYKALVSFLKAIRTIVTKTKCLNQIS